MFDITAPHDSCILWSIEIVPVPAFALVFLPAATCRWMTSANGNYPAKSSGLPSKTVTRAPSGVRCNVNWPAASRPSVKVEQQMSQSQKNTGPRTAFAMLVPEAMSPDLAFITTSNANNLPLPSFRNEVRHTGLAHLPSMSILYMDFFDRIPTCAMPHGLRGPEEEMIQRRRGDRLFRGR